MISMRFFARRRLRRRRRPVLATESKSIKNSAASSRNIAVSSNASSGSAASASASAIAGTALSPCALACITAIANTTECGILSNITCACTNADFQFKAGSCLHPECQANEMGAALGLQAQQCGAASISTTALPAAIAPITPSNSAGDISGSPSDRELVQSAAPARSLPSLVPQDYQPVYPDFSQRGNSDTSGSEQPRDDDLPAHDQPWNTSQPDDGTSDDESGLHTKMLKVHSRQVTVIIKGSPFSVFNSEVEMHDVDVRKRHKKRKHIPQADLDSDVDDSPSRSEPAKKKRKERKLPSEVSKHSRKALAIHIPWPVASESGDPSADDDQFQILIGDAWVEAIEFLELDPEHFDEISLDESNLICSRISQFHGCIMAGADKLVRTGYGFIDIQSLDDPTPKNIAAAQETNRQLRKPGFQKDKLRILGCRPSSLVVFSRGRLSPENVAVSPRLCWLSCVKCSQESSIFARDWVSALVWISDVSVVNVDGGEEGGITGEPSKRPRRLISMRERDPLEKVHLYRQHDADPARERDAPSSSRYRIGKKRFKRNQIQPIEIGKTPNREGKPNTQACVQSTTWHREQTRRAQKSKAPGYASRRSSSEETQRAPAP
ncbi:hypothetical protein B0H13DRAFT_2415342 [Mycena leptocephala]|nr:hypothetical protein B0H13DRAFT_2415342 [Mycena leptocephala]